LWGHMSKLTALAVKNAKKPGKYQDGQGLFLLVRPSGTKSWLLRVQVEGKRREFGIGAASDVSLLDARERANQIRRQYRSGIDPVAARRAEILAQREIPSFRTAAGIVHEERKGSWSNGKHQKQWISSLEQHAFPSLGDLSVAEIDAPAIRQALIPIWHAIPETARRVLQRIGNVLDWAHANGFRPQEAPIRSVSMGLPKQQRRENHFAAMPYEQVPSFFDQLSNSAPTIGRLGLRFAILTAARSGEVRGATWSEIDLDTATWSIPASRMKAKRNHVVPLSRPAIDLLSERRSESGSSDAASIVFPGTRGGQMSDMTLSKVMRDAKQPFTVHGFRSSFKDWASEQTSFPDAVSEAALAHGDPDKVRKAYRRTDFLKLRRELMDAWSVFLTSRAKIEPPGIS